MESSDEMEEWIADYNRGLAEQRSPGGPSPSGEPGFTGRDLADALGLPEKLPPIRQPPEAELAEVARANVLVERAAQLAGWSGDMRTITSDGLTAPDTVAAAAELGIAAPADEAVASMNDVPELAHLWWMTDAAGFISHCTGHVHVDDPYDLSDDEIALAAWDGAFTYVVVGSLGHDASWQDQQDLDLSGVGIMTVITMFMAAGPVPIAELSELAHDLAAGDESWNETELAWRRWLDEHGDPLITLLDRLAELEAVRIEDDAVELTDLGRMGVRSVFAEMGVDVPVLPPPHEMSADDLVAAGEGLDPEHLATETQAWLVHRDPAAAASEPLDIAEAGDAAQRILATSIVTHIGDAAQEQWHKALDRPALRPYAIHALAGLAESGAVEIVQAPPPDAEDAAWMLIDLVAASLDEDDSAVAEYLRDGVPPGSEADLFDVMWRLQHPDAADVLTRIGRAHPDRKIAKLARKAAFKANSVPR